MSRTVFSYLKNDETIDALQFISYVTLFKECLAFQSIHFPDNPERRTTRRCRHREPGTRTVPTAPWALRGLNFNTAPRCLRVGLLVSATFRSRPVASNGWETPATSCAPGSSWKTGSVGFPLPCAWNKYNLSRWATLCHMCHVITSS